jgi:hypothetical protein
MAKFAYEYGQRWNAMLPRNSLRCWVSRVHCATSDEDMIAQLRALFPKATANWTKTQLRLIPQCERYALAVFSQNKAVYRRVLIGNF